MEKEGQPLALNDTQIDQFLSYLDGPRYPERDKAIFALTIRAGMRIGSIAQL
jgi:integrase